ncbi:protein phosphatase 1 regulatory subunit 37 [Discoglossus pictus]
MEMPLECNELPPMGSLEGEEQHDKINLESGEEGSGEELGSSPQEEERIQEESTKTALTGNYGDLTSEAPPTMEKCQDIISTAQPLSNPEAPPLESPSTEIASTEGPPVVDATPVVDVTLLSTEGNGQGELVAKNGLSMEEENGRSKQGPKRVTFPSDDDIVSGALEPKDPWRHAQNVTVEDVIMSYTQACQKLNCKQIPKLIRQLQDLTDLSGRVDSLDLKGERLDHKACEALEEVFKRVQFKMVDLEQTNLDEDGASALFDMIEYYESATHLNISFNKHIGTRGWQAAAHMMRKTNCLQYLDARNTPLLDHSAPFVARALRISSSLTVLHLENCSLSGRPLMLLATALKMNIVLRELYLADNRLNSLQDSAQLGNVLKFNSCIQILDLRNNHIMDSGLAYICEGIKEQHQGLVTLVLWNNQLTHAGMVYMSMCLPHTQTLETLNLGHNAVGNEGVRHLKNGLIGNRSVLRLGLASAKLTCEGAVAVAEFVAESPRLLRLDLRENEIKTGGLMALSLALRVNQSLLRLDLDREPKKEAVKSFIDTQRALLTEIQNGCRRNFVLAKEKEERLQHSASMAEIACPTPEDSSPASEDPNTAPEDASCTPEESIPSSKDPSQAPEEEEDGESSNTPDPQGEESDSDTEEEEEKEEVVVVKEAEPEVPRLQKPTGQVEVSSPGRGHKVFLVTRVENPNVTDGGKGDQTPAVGLQRSPALANGLEMECGETAPNRSNKDSCDTYSDSELEDLLRDASSEPDPALNVVTI